MTRSRPSLTSTAQLFCCDMLPACDLESLCLGYVEHKRSEHTEHLSLANSTQDAAATIHRFIGRRGATH